MAFTINRLLVRMIKASRDFSFVDKIGELTTTLINTIPETELQRNGQYGALVIINNKYKFEAQITKTENNVDTILSDELASESFKAISSTLSNKGNVLYLLCNKSFISSL